MTKLDLNTIRKRAEAATEGPWQINDRDYYDHKRAALVTNGHVYVAKVFAGNTDAEFIAHARQDVPALIAEVERLRKSQEALTNSYVNLLVHDIELMDAYIPGWREYAVKELSALKELITNGEKIQR